MKQTKSRTMAVKRRIRSSARSVQVEAVQILLNHLPVALS